MAEEKVTDRSFQPLTDQDLKGPATAEAPGQPAKRPAARGVPTAHVNPEVVREFGEEVVTKVSTGQKRMRWFANHIILFVIGIAVAISLKMTIYADLDEAFFLLGFGGWVGLLAIHANYALSPLLKRSRKESQIKAVIPQDDTNGEN